VYGVELGTRMTVVRLGDGGLLLHSPVRLDDRLRGQLAELGHVRFLIAPNRWHHMFVGDYQRAYPEALLFAPERLRDKRPDLRIDASLVAGTLPREVDTCFVAGVPIFDESVILHRASGTLITSDLLVHVEASSPRLTRLVFRLIGNYGQPGWGWLERRMFVKDRRALRASVEQILTWPFDRIVLAHGMPVEHGGQTALHDAFQWLLTK
jgi:hypothetical protein